MDSADSANLTSDQYGHHWRHRVARVLARPSAKGNKSLHFGELLSILRLPQLPKYLQPFLAFIELNHS